MISMRNLGQSPIQISPIGLGTWQFSGGKGLIGGYWQGISHEDTKAIVKAALDNGINWFDTAQAYGKGQSEYNLAQALSSLNAKPEEALIATKWWPVFKTAENLKKTITDRERFLSPYPISNLMVHQPLSVSSVEKQMHAMADLMDEKRILSVGVSNFSAKAMEKAHKTLQERGYTLACNQYRYSMLTRDIEHNGILDTAKALGITVIAWSPLEQGILTGRFHKEKDNFSNVNFLRRQMLKQQSKLITRTMPLIEAMDKLAEKYEVGIAQIALNYIIHAHGDTIVAIPGASSVKQVENNAKAQAFQLSTEEMNDLTACLDSITR